ncbi:outer membrane protein [Rhizobium tumorigenes]|uniref:outer membrane protein n=1 Tax=Rhizobium tumorigenes TaxID=2041385 RepID=UPI00241E62DE|nr:outer membrane protein [Rhizobium tumorigenes]WFS04368.1 porin family protein [Rhizobium tumorigenes]
MHIKSFVFAIIAISSTAPAMAADLSVVPEAAPAAYSTYDWSGFYIGAQGGYSWNQTTVLGTKEDLDNGSAGIHAGYNFQSGSIVYGIENDFNYNFAKDKDTDLEWDASGRGRIGYALDRTLIFATAGIAATSGKLDIPAIRKKDDILIGWTAGGGVEHAITDNILVRGEYRYSDFGKKDFGAGVGDFGATQNKVLIGASYKF